MTFLIQSTTKSISRKTLRQAVSGSSFTPLQGEAREHPTVPELAKHGLGCRGDFRVDGAGWERMNAWIERSNVISIQL